MLGDYTACISVLCSKLPVQVSIVRNHGIPIQVFALLNLLGLQKSCKISFEKINNKQEQ